ncbi:MAG: winged helix-turn-helix domain-containing protein [Fusobacteria bacterium]|nr:winged helix-turn-helix domain-containing protein [Fusobacteriota bacterium]
MRYDAEVIGQNAGIIWRNLSEKGELNITGLEKSAELKKEDILLALGWLYKEDKIASKQVGKGIKFYLK